MRRIKETVLSILDSVIEIIQVFAFFVTIICWLLLGLIWSWSVRSYYKTKKYFEKFPMKVTIFILKLYDKLLTFNEKWFIIKK